MIQLVKDELFMAVWGMGDMNGLQAWRRKYNPSTPAIALTGSMRVTPPGRVKNQRKLAAMMDELHTRVEAFRSYHAEDFSENMRIAALLQMLPLDMRHLACHSLGGKATLASVRDRIRGLVANRLSMDEAGTIPMEIGGRLGLLGVARRVL